MPVVFTNVEYRPDGSDGGVFYRKAPVLKASSKVRRWAPFFPMNAPAGDRVFTKQYPSAFFATGLAAALHAEGSIHC